MTRVSLSLVAKRKLRHASTRPSPDLGVVPQLVRCEKAGRRIRVAQNARVCDSLRWLPLLAPLCQPWGGSSVGRLAVKRCALCPAGSLR